MPSRSLWRRTTTSPWGARTRPSSGSRRRSSAWACRARWRRRTPARRSPPCWKISFVFSQTGPYWACFLGGGGQHRTEVAFLLITISQRSIPGFPEKKICGIFHCRWDLLTALLRVKWIGVENVNRTLLILVSYTLVLQKSLFPTKLNSTASIITRKINSAAHPWGDQLKDTLLRRQ